MTDWADEKALELARDIREIHAARGGTVPALAAALREAYERGRREERKGAWAVAMDEARELAEQLLPGSMDQSFVAHRIARAIAARGPMRKPEEE